MIKKKLLTISIKRSINMDLFMLNSSPKSKIFLVKSEVRKIKKYGYILVIALYSAQNHRAELKYVLFFNKKHEYITRDFSNKEPKWRIASLGKLICDYNVLIKDKDANIIYKFLLIPEDKRSSNILRDISNIQAKKLDEKLEARHERIKNTIDKKMAMVPKLPEKFKEWVDEKALYKSRYIYYKYENKKEVKGYCTHCKKDVIVKRHKHNKTGICPNCGSKITFKSIGKSKRIFDHIKISIIQKIRNGYVVRYFNVYKDYYNYRNPKIDICEITREVHLENDVEFFEWANFLQTGEERWTYPTNCNALDVNSTILYTKNLGYVTGNVPELKYSQISEASKGIIKHDILFNVWGYIHVYKKYPFVEYIVKEKLFVLLREIVSSISFSGDIVITSNFDTKEKSIFKIFKLDGNYFKTLKRLDGGLDMLELLQNLKAHKINTSDQNILFLSKFVKTYNFKYVVNIMRYCSINKIVKYIKSQLVWEQYNEKNCGEFIWGKHNNLRNVLSDWRDYLRNMKFLNMDLKNDFVLFPKNLYKKHNEILKFVKENENELYDKAILKQFKNKMEKYFWQDKNYVIVVPKQSKDILNEGKNLHHCVASYISDVAREETTILFLREKNNISKSFFTIEVKDNFIAQCRGLIDCDPPKKVVAAVQKFKKEKLYKLKVSERIDTELNKAI